MTPFEASTRTLYTIAQIADIGNRLLTQSTAAMERSMKELRYRAAAERIVSRRFALKRPPR